jgi:hypothetical protein
VLQVQVKSVEARSSWVWGAFRMPGRIFHELYELWHARGEREAYFGTLVNAWLARGGYAVGIRAGDRYVDVGTLHGYREAIRLLAAAKEHAGSDVIAAANAPRQTPRSPAAHPAR